MRNIIYTPSEIFRNFRIKVIGLVNGRKVNTLVGVSGAIKLVGEEMFRRLVSRAFACNDDICACKLRRGLKFTFYGK